MAAFIAKQMVGSQLKSVKGALGDENKKEEGGGGGEEDPEIEEARREAEEKRMEKHRKMELEREEMRQSIRDKYGLKKKVPEEEVVVQDAEGRIGRKRKTPAELAAEASKEEEEEDDDMTIPTNLSELTSKVQDLPSKLASSMGEVSSKCSLQ